MIDDRESATREALASLDGWPSGDLDVERDVVLVGASPVPLVAGRWSMARLLTGWGIDDAAGLLDEARRCRPVDHAAVVVIVRDDTGSWLSVAFVRIAEVHLGAA